MSQDIAANLELGGVEVIEKLAPSWRKLCEEVQCGPFLRPEWMAAYVRAFEPRSEVVIATAFAGDRMLAVLPMVRKRAFYAGIPVRKLAGTANSHSVRFDILRTRGGVGDEALQQLWTLLKHTPDWQVLELPLFPENSASADFLNLAAKDGHPTLTLLRQKSPILRFHVNGNGSPGVPAYQPSRHFRHELRRFLRILSSEVGAEPNVTCLRDPTHAMLNQFFALEQAGWKGEQGSAIGCRPETRAFYEEIARAGAEAGYFRLHSLEANGTMLAGAFSVVTPGGFFPMKMAHDERLRRGGPGHLLFNAIVNECAEQRIPELFFGGKDEYYKSLWTQETLAHFSAYVFSDDIHARLAYQIRSRVLSPLGRIRWHFIERFGRARNGPKRRGSSNTSGSKSKVVPVSKLPTAPDPKECQASTR